MSDAWGESWGGSGVGTSSEALPGSVCTTNTCGTGGWTGPLPGDPDNNIVINAVGISGGIEVSWSYPNTNAHAVAHVILYRGENEHFNQAVQRGIMSGNSFYDRISKAYIKDYYYWIRVLSVNGTLGDPIGPAMATPLDAAIETLESLTGIIDDTYLAQTLKTSIDKIALLDDALGKSILERIQNNEELLAALAAVQSETGEAMTFVKNETIERKSVDSALVTSVNAIAAGLAGNSAAILEEKTVRVTNEEAVAQQVDTLYTNFEANEVAILTEQTARTTAIDSLAHSITTLAAQTAAMGAGIQTETNARVTGDTALATQIQTAQTVMGDTVASVQTAMESKIAAVDGKAGALYTAKVQVNGLIGGFGIYNDGTVVDAGFDVDRFWIGRTNTNKTKPFIISGDKVYIDDATINKISFTKMTDAAGAFIVEGGKVKADYITIGNAVIKTANIDDLQVDTIKIKNAAVTSFFSVSRIVYSGAGIASIDVSFVPDGWSFIVSGMLVGGTSAVSYNGLIMGAIGSTMYNVETGQNDIVGPNTNGVISGVCTKRDASIYALCTNGNATMTLNISYWKK